MSGDFPGASLDAIKASGDDMMEPHPVNWRAYLRANWVRFRVSKGMNPKDAEKEAKRMWP